MISKDLFRRPNLPLESVGREPGQDAQPEVKCPGCSRSLPQDELAGNLHVCPRCRHYHKMSARARIAMVQYLVRHKEKYPENKAVLAALREKETEPSVYRELVNGLH